MLKESGYLVQSQILDTRRFALPQSRKRVYIVGQRNDAVRSWSWMIARGLTAFGSCVRVCFHCLLVREYLFAMLVLEICWTAHPLY